MAHTPGPWTWVSELTPEGDLFRWLAGPDKINERGVVVGNPVIDVISARDGDSLMAIENPADAALIAAAPEMLAMLESVEVVLDSIVMDESLKEAGLLQGPMVARTRALVLDVILKARGKDA